MFEFNWEIVPKFFYFLVIVPKFFPIKNSAKHGLAQLVCGDIFEPCDLIGNLRRQNATTLGGF